MNRFLFASLVLFCARIPVSWGWGAEGHRIIVYIAEQELTVKTSNAVHHLIDSDSLANVANWLDGIRGTPEGEAMGAWHYDNITVCDPPRTSCIDGNCATARIHEAIQTLRQDRHGQEAQRALKILVHLVADIHQPLHAAENGDYGGNAITVANRRCRDYKTCKLHAYWDVQLVKKVKRRQSEMTLARQLARLPNALSTHDSNDPHDWAIESRGLAKQVAYHYDGFACHAAISTIKLTAAYDKRAMQTVRLQLARAGHRLARILNAIYDS